MTRPRPSTTHVESPGPSRRTIDLDELFGVLSSAWCRRAIRALANRSETTAADELVDTLHAEHGTTTDRSSTRIAFYHNHLPRLADHGIVEFDREADTVRPGEHLSTAADSLAAIDDERSTRSVEH